MVFISAFSGTTPAASTTLLVAFDIDTTMFQLHQTVVLLGSSHGYGEREEGRSSAVRVDRLMLVCHAKFALTSQYWTAASSILSDRATSKTYTS